ncbi:hypothetical protein [Bradyrhizobium sp. CB3481]|uniref:hypothetical protein n=1 Tax=Bradyrhizobium sp. CB3481 TaxID=3039158 RepID=UPI0024B1C112|nr:hypothetical protein [Bradyrhizobium sp. CB3481]WFU19372.1 hypothetical protein QA643_13960 [Bradyrhizobium sp. CB3481]
MIERLSHEPASVPAEDDDRSDRLQALELLRAQLSRTISEGLGQGSVAAQWGEIDNAQIAAFLDGSLSRAEWEAVAARLVSDPVARAELAAAVALLDETQAQPRAAPADLVERAAGVLGASEQAQPHASAAAVTSVAWYRRSMAWPGFALAALAIIAVPAVLKMAGDGTPTAIKPGDPGDTFSRGIVAAPSSPAKKKDAQSCNDAEQARKPAADNAGNDRRATAVGPAEHNDSCGPKPAAAGKNERAAPAGSN